MPACGNCLYQGDAKAVTSNGIEVPCLFHEGQRHKDSYKCENYIEYFRLPLPERINLARGARNDIETQKRYQETARIAKEANKIAKHSNIIGWVIGIGGLVVGIISVGVAIYLGVQNKELKGIRQDVATYVQNIQQNNYYVTLPAAIKDSINKIAVATGNTVTFNDKTHR